MKLLVVFFALLCCAAAPVGTHSVVVGGGGVKLSVYSWGKADGPPILFIHGVSQSHLIWTHQVDSDLARDFRIVALDLRGQGESEKPLSVAAYNTSELYADDIAAVLHDLDLHRPVVVAWSAGGFVLCDYLRKYGDGGLAGINFIAVSTKRGVPSALALKGKGSSTGSAAHGLQSPLAEENIDATIAFVKSMAYKPLPPDELARIVALNMQTPPEIRAMLSVRPVDNGDVLAKITVPVLLDYGAEDQIVNPQTASAYVSSMIKGAKLSIYPQAGHLLFIDQARKYNAQLRDFVLRVNHRS